MRRLIILRTTAIITAFLVVAVLIVSGLTYLKFEKVVRETQKTTLEITSRSLVETIESAMDLGMQVKDFGSLQPKVRLLADAHGSIVKVTANDLLNRTILDTSETDEDKAAQNSAATEVGSAELKIMVRPVVNDFGETAATLRIFHDDSTVNRVLRRLVTDFLWACAASFSVAILLVTGAMTWMSRRRTSESDADFTQRLQRSIFLLSGVTVVSVVLFVSLSIFNCFEREVRPLMQGEAAAIAGAIVDPLSRTSESEFNFATIPDVTAFLDDSLKLYRQAVAIGIRQADGWTMIRKADPGRSVNLVADEGVDAPATFQTDGGFEAVIPLRHAERVVAWLHVITSPDAVIVATTDARWDIAILIYVSLLIIFEAVRFIFAFQSFGPQDKESATRKKPGLARLPLFMFLASEQLTTSFLVIHGRELAGSGASSLIYALPIVAFVAAIAISGSYAARLIATIGTKRTLVVSCAIAAVGYFLAFATSHIWALIFARAVNGVGYSIAMIALQSLMSRGSNDAEIKANLASFTTTITTGSICGASVGGLLAEQIGVHPVFFLAGALALAPILFYTILDDDEAKLKASQKPFGFAQAMRIPAFVALLGLVAIPTKIVITAFVLYFAPLYLKDIGFSQAAVARNVMLYSVFMMPAVGLGSYLIRRNTPGALLMVSASFMTCAALAAASLETGLAIALIGVMHGMASVPVLGTVPKIADGDRNRQVALFALLRSGERIGSVTGPLVAGLILIWVPLQHAPLALMGLMLIFSSALAAYHILSARSKKR